ncbi:hypothetical protein ACU4GD_26220 [Cupriavidus basilensis]
MRETPSSAARARSARQFRPGQQAAGSDLLANLARNVVGRAQYLDEA